MIRSTIRPGDRVLELGSGLGVTTMTTARIVGAAALRSYEANPRLIDPLVANAARNGLDIRPINQVLLPYASSQRKRTITFADAGEFWAISALSENEGSSSFEVQTSCIEDVIDDFGPNVLVMDIEGLEVEILEQADLRSIEKIIVEIHYDKAGRRRTNAAVLGLLSRGFEIDFENTRSGVILASR